MRRTTVDFPEETHEQLRRLAAQRRQSMGKIIREAVDEKLAQAKRKPKAIGVFSSGYTDTAEKAGDWKFEPRSWRS